MIRLFINGIECDTPQNISIPIGMSLSKLSDVQSARSGRTIELELKGSERNKRVLGASYSLYNAKRFNSEQHKGRIEVDGLALLEGTVYLLSSQHKQGRDICYHIRIVGGGAEWAKQAAHKRVRNCGIEFSMALTPLEIAKTWGEGEHPVRFLPVLRNRYTSEYKIPVYPVEHILTVDDYHPFISVKAVLERVFSEEGYTLESKFFETDLFCSLYFSGEYSSPDTSAQRAKADFLARRAAPVTAKADSMGRVFASPGALNYSVGNFVDTADPSAIDYQNRRMSDTFATNNVFHTDSDGYICFSPTSAVNAGFILHLEYETEFRILSRTQLKGFDTIEFTPGARLKASLSNTYEDFRDKIAALGSYKLFIFDFKEGDRFRLTTKDSSGNSLSTLSISKQCTVVTMPNEVGLSCVCEREVNGSYVEYEGDWALYESFIAERGTKSVIVDLRTPSQEFSAGERCYFNELFISGADPDMSITLNTECSLRPYFSANPGHGSNIAFKDITHNSFWLIDLLDAIRQMFNLVIYTDTRHKRVIIEPMEEFFKGGKVVDWSSRIDTSQPITLSDAGMEAPQWRVLKYTDADKASEQFNAQNNTTLGRWSSENPLYGAVASTRTILNPLFTTGVNKQGYYAIAPSASIMQVGDTIADGSIDTPFTPHIVIYAGLQPLPEGELWGYPINEPTYPLAAFHFAGTEESAPFSLCFEDRDGAEGLHRYYDEAMHREAEREYLTLTMILSPLDIEQLLYRSGTNTSAKTIFRLKVGNESSLFLLESLQEYTPATGRAKCKFIRLTRDF